MHWSTRSLVSLALSLSLSFSGCASKTFLVRESDLHRDIADAEVIGAVGAGCHQTAVRRARISADEQLPSDYEGYVYVRETTSRTLSFGIGLGSILLGVGMTSFGALMLRQSADSRNQESLTFGAATPTLGAISIAGGGTLAGFGIATSARGARKGAEVPRRWSPAMTADAPCVDDQRGEALTRARARGRQARNDNARMPLPHPARTLQAPTITPEPSLGANDRESQTLPAPEVP